MLFKEFIENFDFDRGEPVLAVGAILMGIIWLITGIATLTYLKPGEKQLSTGQTIFGLIFLFFGLGFIFFGIYKYYF